MALPRIKSIGYSLASMLVALGTVLPVRAAALAGCEARSDTLVFSENYPAGNVFQANVTGNDDTSGGQYYAHSGGQTASGANWWVTENGNFGYVPVDGYVGTESVRYELYDPATRLACSSAQITITTNAPGYKRLAGVDDTANTSAMSSVTVDVMKNDRFVSPPNIASVTNLTPEMGTFSIVDNPDPSRFLYEAVRFTPQNNPLSGVAQARYTLTDAYGNVSSATLNVSVAHVNIAPTTTNERYTLAEDAALSGNVLTNDTDPDSTLTARLMYGPQFGTLAWNTNGTFTYTPHANYNGTDSFVYYVSDGQYTVPARADITVTSVNDAPIASFIATPQKGRSATFDTSASYDIDDSIVTYSWKFGDGTTATTNTPLTSRTYKKAGTYTVTLTITDSNGAVATTTRSITVR